MTLEDFIANGLGILTLVLGTLLAIFFAYMLYMLIF